MRVLTTDEVRQAERHAVEAENTPTLLLMQRAGFATAQFCLMHFRFETVCVMCGKGNNGGDGLVAAQALVESGKKPVDLDLLDVQRRLALALTKEYQAIAEYNNSIPPALGMRPTPSSGCWPTRRGQGPATCTSSRAATAWNCAGGSMASCSPSRSCR